MMPKNVKCKHCDKLKNHWCKAVLDSPDEDMEHDCRHFRHKTNADRIRTMSDEELAEYLVYHNPYSTEENCLRWLKQPVGD